MDQEAIIETDYRIFAGSDDICEKSEATRNYSEYDIFRLKTKLVPFVHKILQREDVDVRFVMRRDEGVFYSDAVICEASGSISLISNDQKQIFANFVQDEIDAPYSLLLSSEYFGYMRHYFPFVIKGRNFASNESGIYINLEGIRDYNEFYEEKKVELEQKLRALYNSGYFVLENRNIERYRSILEAWKAKRINTVNDSTLMRVEWIDERFAFDKTSFILSRLRGDTSIVYKISRDLFVNRHMISKYLSDAGYLDFKFFGDKVVFHADSLERTIELLAIIEDAVYDNHGDVDLQVNVAGFIPIEMGEDDVSYFLDNIKYVSRKI